MSDLKPTRRAFLQTMGAGAAAFAVPTVIWSPAKAATTHFKLYLTIFNNQQTRMIWTDLIGKNIAELGVEVITSFVPVTELVARRSNDTGATYVDGGFDMYSERILYPAMMPLPDMLFSKAALPPLGKNYYRIQDDILEVSMEDYTGSADPEVRATALKAFQKRFYELQPFQTVFYPEDVIAVNPDLEGFNATTYNPVFFPRPENWTLNGMEGDVSSAFASWPAPSSLVPMYTVGYHESNIFGPVYNALTEFTDWETKKAEPALAESVTSSEDGLVWTIKLREGLKWHSGAEFTADDVIFTFDTILTPEFASVQNSALLAAMGSKDAYKKTGTHAITVTLPKYSILFEAVVLPSVAILPKHAYGDIAPEELRKHTIATWTGTHEVKLPDGSTYVAKGGIGTGPWVAEGFDPVRKAYKMSKNKAYWKETAGNVTEFYVVNIQGSDAVLSALKAGEIDAHDAMYDIGTLVSTIDEDWGKVVTFDSYKWQQTCLNMAHPVFGTGVETPLGKQDPARAAEAATYIRQAFSHAIPREQIIKNLIGGYGKPGTIPMPFTAAEYDHETLQPIPYDMEIAKSFMAKAGYTA